MGDTLICILNIEHVDTTLKSVCFVLSLVMQSDHSFLTVQEPVIHGHDNVVANAAAARKQRRCDTANSVWPCFHNLVVSLLSSELADHSLRCGGHIPRSACSPDFIFINIFIVVCKR